MEITDEMVKNALDAWWKTLMNLPQDDILRPKGNRNAEACVRAALEAALKDVHVYSNWSPR